MLFMGYLLEARFTIDKYAKIANGLKKVVS